MRTISVLNQKGGVGKTTTVANLGSALATLGRRVLLVDLDPQSHLTLHLGQETTSEQPSIYRVLLEGMPLEQAVVPRSPNLYVVGSNIDLAGAEIELVSVVGREVILRDALDKVRDRFDICLVDCPPSLGVLTLNALAAVEEVIIPLQPHFLALQGLGRLLETVALVSRRINPRLTVGGVLLCMYESGTRLAAEVTSDLESFLANARHSDLPWSKAKVFETLIRRNVRLAESPSYGKTIFDYAPKCHGASDYLALAKELMGIPKTEVGEGEAPSGPSETPDKPAVDARPSAEPASEPGPETPAPKPGQKPPPGPHAPVPPPGPTDKPSGAVLSA
jgi:chromosome partitioning protein